MPMIVAQLSTVRKPFLPTCANDSQMAARYASEMGRLPIIRKQPRRPHFVAEWAESAGLPTQADLSRAIGADKSTVSRWYSGTTPTPEWQIKLADFFDCTPDALFRHPDEGWFAEFFRDRTADEIRRIKATIATAFPKEDNKNK